MNVFVLGDKNIVLALSAENIMSIKNGEPIVVQLSSSDLGEDIVIMAAETVDDVLKEVETNPMFVKKVRH